MAWPYLCGRVLPLPHRRLGTGLRVAAAKRICVPDRTPWTSRWWLRKRIAPRRQAAPPRLPRCIHQKKKDKEKRKKKKEKPKEEKKTPLGKPESLAGNEGPAEHP